MSAVTSYAKGDMGGVFKSVTGLIKTASGNTQKAGEYARATRTSPADVVCGPRILFGLNGVSDHDLLLRRSRGVDVKTLKLVLTPRKPEVQLVL